MRTAWYSLVPLVAILLAAGVVHEGVEARQLAWGGMRAEWSDLSTWTTPDEATREVEHGLGLILQGAGGSVKVAFMGRMSTRDPNRPPTMIRVQVGTGNVADPNHVREPGARFVADPGTDKTVEIDLTSRLTTDAAVGDTIENATAMMSSREFASIARATRVLGRVLGYEVEFRADQIRALRTLTERLKL